MPAQVRILVVDDDEITCNLLEEVLSKEGYLVHKALNGREAIRKGEQGPYDVVLTDIRMLDVDGMEVLRVYRQRHPETIIVMMTAFGSIETAIRAIKEGAYDYVSKPFKLEEIKLTIHRALEQKRLMRENIHYRQELITKYKLENIVGRSPQMLDVYKTIARVAESRSTVLITGESGTGKELIARAIHFNSPRSARPFVAVDCSSLAETLLESELFGHVRGAFTGAVANKMGLFEEADTGTCFLDEIGDIQLATQAKLLRVLQEHEIKRVGGNETIKIDVRVVAATNKNLEEEIERGNFREDLFYRLNVIPFHVPPLRDRKEDIALLADHFLAEFTRAYGRKPKELTPQAYQVLSEYHWPGNVRELENVIERALILTKSSTLTADAFLVREDRPRPSEEGQAELLTLDDAMASHIQKALDLAEGRVHGPGGAARLLGVNPSTLRNKMNRLGIRHGKGKGQSRSG